MNVLKAAIVGLSLVTGNTLVRADVITDWNRTAMDVMKAVNVAGNPWTRSMALVNVSMSDAVNSVQNRYSRYIPELPTDPNASAEAAAAAGIGYADLCARIIALSRFRQDYDRQAQPEQKATNEF